MDHHVGGGTVCLVPHGEPDAVLGDRGDRRATVHDHTHLVGTAYGVPAARHPQLQSPPPPFLVAHHVASAPRAPPPHPPPDTPADGRIGQGGVCTFTFRWSPTSY